MRQVLGFLRRADEDYGMIGPEETIAVGVSGGKDSMALLYALHLYKNFARVRFSVHAFTVDLGFDSFDADTVAGFCARLGIPHTLVKTRIANVVFEQRRESNPCALCAKLRKGMLFTAVRKAGLSTCAFAHHREDCLESLFMSMLYEGRMRTFRPVTPLDRSGIKLVRPLICLPESQIGAAARRHSLPVVANPCPAAGTTRREQTKRLLAQICASNPNARDMMLTALRNIGQYSLWE